VIIILWEIILKHQFFVCAKIKNQQIDLDIFLGMIVERNCRILKRKTNMIKK